MYEGAYTNLQRANIEYDYLRGIPIKQILKYYGLSRKGLYKALKRWGVNLKERKENRHKKVINALKYGGLTTIEVAVQNNYKIRTVYYICKKNGFNLRWRSIKILESRKSKLRAECLDWRSQNKSIFKRWQRKRRDNNEPYHTIR